MCARMRLLTHLLGPDLVFMYDFMTLFAENVTEVDFEAERDDIVKFYATFTPPPANKLQVLRPQVARFGPFECSFCCSLCLFV
jgi:hypothetical protein